MYAGLSNPLHQRRAGDHEPCAAKDFLFPVQRQVVSELRHHQMSQQAYGRDTFVDCLGRYWCLDQCFAMTAGPFSTHMLLDGEYAWRGIQLLADVFANALKLATADALGVFWLGDGSHYVETAVAGAHDWVSDVARCRWRIERFQLGLDGRDIRFEQVVEQATLVRA